MCMKQEASSIDSDEISRNIFTINKRLSKNGWPRTRANRKLLLSRARTHSDKGVAITVTIVNYTTIGDVATCTANIISIYSTYICTSSNSMYTIWVSRTRSAGSILIPKVTTCECEGEIDLTYWMYDMHRIFRTSTDTLNKWNQYPWIVKTVRVTVWRFFFSRSFFENEFYLRWTCPTIYFEYWTEFGLDWIILIIWEYIKLLKANDEIFTYYRKYI